VTTDNAKAKIKTLEIIKKIVKILAASSRGLTSEKPTVVMVITVMYTASNQE
jgi:hypothetical protein